MPVNVAKKNVTADGSMFGENKETLSSDAAPPAPSAPVASSKKKGMLGLCVCVCVSSV